MALDSWSCRTYLVSTVRRTNGRDVGPIIHPHTEIGNVDDATNHAIVRRGCSLTELADPLTTHLCGHTGPKFCLAGLARENCDADGDPLHDPGIVAGGIVWRK